MLTQNGRKYLLKKVYVRMVKSIVHTASYSHLARTKFKSSSRETYG